MSAIGPLGAGLPFLDHELVSYAVFLEYRSRRIRAPIAAAAADPPDGMTAPTGPAPRAAVACIDPPATSN